MGMDIDLYQFTVDPRLVVEKEREYYACLNALYQQMIQDYGLPEEYCIDEEWPEKYSTMYWDKSRGLLDKIFSAFDPKDVRTRIGRPSPHDPETWIGYFDSRYGENPDIDNQSLIVQYIQSFEWRSTGNFNRALLFATEQDLSDIFCVGEQEYQLGWVFPDWDKAYQRCYSMMLEICLGKDLDYLFPYWYPEDLYKKLRVVLLTIEFVLSRNKELQKMYALRWSC